MAFESKKTNLILVLTSEANVTIAEDLAKIILEKRLAACANLKEIKSYFWWDGRLQEENEVQILIKTTQSQLQNLLDAINKLHTYQTPEILWWNASVGDVYGEWASQSVCVDLN